MLIRCNLNKIFNFFSVLQLQEQIELIYKIPLSEQVLLASGGECLDSNARVCTYSAGTDTNPIFLFRRKLEEGPPKPKKDEGPPPTDIGNVKFFYMYNNLFLGCVSIVAYLIFFFLLF